MIDDIRSGELMMAYNVVGSYAANAFGPDDDGIVVPLQDYTHILQRTALIPASATAESVAGRFIDCLLYTSPSPRDRQKSRMPSSA